MPNTAAKVIVSVATLLCESKLIDVATGSDEQALKRMLNLCKPSCVMTTAAFAPKLLGLVGMVENAELPQPEGAEEKGIAPPSLVVDGKVACFKFEHCMATAARDSRKGPSGHIEPRVPILVPGPNRTVAEQV